MDKQRERLNAALNLMRRMPPSLASNTIAGLLELQPDIADDLLTRVEQPLIVAKNPNSGNEYIKCEYNRDGDNHRAPDTNEYFPNNEGFRPRQQLRNMETLANRLFDIYRNLYFEEGSVSSVYFFDTDASNVNTFGACWSIHKEVENLQGLKSGIWDSVHVFELCPVKDKEELFTYKLTSNVNVSMKLEGDAFNLCNMSASRMQQDHKQLKVSKKDPKKYEATHVSNMGKMLEDNELRIRNSIERIYIDKTRAIVNGIRSYKSKDEKEWANFAEHLPEKEEKE